MEDDIDSGPLLRVPGLYRRWEIAELLQPGEDYRLEDAGTTSDGTPLFAVYRTVGEEVCDAE